MVTTVKIYNMTDAWINANTNYNAIKMNVANTASAAGSVLIDLQVDGLTKFKIDKTGNLTLAGTVDGRDIAADGIKLDGVAAGATINQTPPQLLTALKTVDGSLSGLDADLLDGLHSTAFATALQGSTANSALQPSAIGISVQAYSSVLTATSASFVTADKNKLNNITITQPVNLDTIEARVNALNAAVVLKGNWNASLGAFPVSTTIGESWIVSVAGTVNGISFVVNDRIVALLTNASTTIYASNWLKLDYTDQVLSVAGRTGAVTLTSADLVGFTDNSTNWNTAFTWGNHALGGYLAATSYTAADVLVKIKTVDGTLSGLDADLLDGQHASAFATALQGSHGQTAFTWGNHALGGYAQAVHTHTTSDITGLAAYITNNAAVLANTAKITNATHTGDVTGNTALTIAAQAVTLAKMANIPANSFIGRNTALSGAPEILTVAAARTLLNLNQQLTTTSSPTFGPIYINEQLAASADVVAKGQIWVKNTTPNQLWFTNDTGADVQLGAAASVTAFSTFTNNIWYNSFDTNNRLYFATNSHTYIASPANFIVQCGTGTTADFTIDIAGNAVAAGNLTANSDRRLKTNIRPIANSMNIVKNLYGKRFIKDGKESIGVIAQEIEQELPEIVVTADDEMKTKSVAYGNIVAVLIEAIKEQQDEIDKLKRSIALLQPSK